ncbi:hypothetical protein lerEdw1_016941 [Lerista edwardsae]|nr:hypothetical protein lerEdw1_016941 [Lerista edwardsae]
MYLPGRRPRDRKKKEWKKKNAEDPCFKDIMLEEGQQTMGQDYWSTAFVGDLDSAQTEAITEGREVSLSPLPTMPLPLCTESCDKNTQDQHIPVPLEKGEEHDRGKTEKTFHTPGKAQPPQEGPDGQSAVSLVTQKKNLVGTVSEGVPFEESKDYVAMPVKETRQSGSPELLSPVLQEAADEKEQQKGEACTGSMPEGEPCKKELQQDDKNVPSQEPQEHTDLEQLHSASAANEKKLQEEQNNTSMDSDGVASLQELLSQPCVPCLEDQQLLEPLPVMGVTHEAEEEVTQGQVNPAFEEEAHKKNRDDEDTPHQEVEQLGEQKYPDILTTIDANNDPEVQKVLSHLEFGSEASPQKPGHNYQPLHEQEDQLLILPKATSFSFQDIAYEKKQTEVQDIRNYTSDTVLSKGEDHQYVSHKVDRQAAPPENMTIFPLGAICTTDTPSPAPTDFMRQDNVVYLAGQKQPETQPFFLGQPFKTPHYNVTDEKEEHEGLDHAYFGSKGIVCTEELEYQEPVVFEDVSMLTDTINYEKEQQRKLDCGDSGPESICDKEDQDHQPALFLQVQEPLALANFSSLALNETSEEQRTRKDNTNTSSLEMEEQQADRDDQGQRLMFAPSQEKERLQDQEEPQPPMAPLAGRNPEGGLLEAWHDQKASSLTCEEQKHREPLKLGMTCEEHHKQEKQGLSNTTFPCHVKEGEGHM